MEKDGDQIDLGGHTIGPGSLTCNYCGQTEKVPPNWDKWGPMDSKFNNPLIKFVVAFAKTHKACEVSTKAT